MENYKSAINHSLNCCPELRQYLDKFVIPAPGDWPTWFYEKKLIAQEMNESSPLLSFIPEQGPFGSPFFSVADAKANLVSVLGNLTLEDTIDLSITTTDPQIPQSSLDFYLQRLDREPNLAALVIANGMTICFVGYNNKIYVLDSHPHNAFRPVFGAMVGMTAKPDLEEFLVNIKRQISPAFNVCSLTFVSF